MYTCVQCDKAFNFLDSLNKHVLAHTDEINLMKKWKCLLNSSNEEGFVISDRSRKWNPGGSHDAMMMPEQILVVTYCCPSLLHCDIIKANDIN